MADEKKPETASAPVAEASGSTSAAAAAAVAAAAAADEAAASAPVGEIIEAEDGPGTLDDGDSALSLGSNASSSTSLASSILKYRVENGRTYHAYKEGSYILPNDEAENERLDLQHHLCIMTIGDRMHAAPIGKDGKDVHRVLDAGCGTGIWAMDFADEHPEAHVIGVDLSPIQPSFVPPNVRFYVDDLEADWTYSEPFDFIYMRMLSASIADWPKLFRQAYDNLAPGGWIELLDPTVPMACDDGSLPPDSPIAKWGELMLEASVKLGSPLNSAFSYKKQLEDAGFVNIVATPYKWPINTWPKDPKFKELGAWSHENILQGLQALSLALFTRALGWQPDALEVFLADVRKDLRNRNFHSYWKLMNVYGQKPL